MPPRITRNSDRPRASDRTMVDTQIPVSLASFKTRLASSPPDDEPTGMANNPEQNLSRTSRGTLTVKWAGSRDKIFSPSGRGRTFFLTSLFIELIDRGREGIRNNGRLLRRGSGPPTLVSSISERDYEVPTFEN